MKKGIVIIGILLLIALNILLYIFYINPLLTMKGTDLQISKLDNNTISGGLAQTGLAQKQLIVLRAKNKEELVLNVEVAKTFEQRSAGLMFRDSLADDYGMIFMFDKEEIRSFWMKNTYIGLDLLFIDKQGVIKHIHNNAVPLDLTSLPSTVPVQYVIEVNNDFVENNTINVGDIVQGI